MTHGRSALCLAFATATTVVPASTSAADPSGVYIGGAIGRATLRTNQVVFTDPSGVPLPGAVSLSGHDTGWKILVGWRPVPLLGTEFEYIDFGAPVASFNPAGFGLGYTVSERAKAGAAFGVLYAPIPAPLLDVYGKAGLARLQATAGGSGAYGCWPPLLCAFFQAGKFQRSEAGTHFAYGAGAQLKFSALAIRAEYERIGDGNGNPDLLSIGVTWTF